MAVTPPERKVRIVSYKSTPVWGLQQAVQFFQQPFLSFGRELVGIDLAGPDGGRLRTRVQTRQHPRKGAGSQRRKQKGSEHAFHERNGFFVNGDALQKATPGSEAGSVF